uniref:epithelial-stromal interaction protein 1 isoform X2 n=1 Tax=Semicossyphus pulcher TaxID=241346 RepID=UPI0037E8C9A4
MMDPYNNNNNQRDNRKKLLNSRNTYQQDNTAGVPGNDEETPVNPDRDAPDSGNPQPTDRQPQYSGGFTVIPPNQSRRSKLTTMAQKEEEDLQRWKEANRPPAVHLNPEKLGGGGTLAEARQKQLVGSRSAKLEKKLKKDESDRRRRQEEEEENQKMKAVQREKAERLEERKRQDEQRRRELHMQDHLRATDSFLQRFERTAPGPPASSSATHTSSRSEAEERSQRQKSLKSEREVQLEHRRVNSAFLDRLEGQGRGSKEWEAAQEEECPYFTSEESDSDVRQQPVAHLDPYPDPSCSGRTQEAAACDESTARFSGTIQDASPRRIPLLCWL